MRDALASDIVDDSVSHPHVFDTGTSSHVKAHPTVEALTSRESLVKLESQSVIGHDTTLPNEKDHAGSKRAQVAREQTHRERLDLASAARVTRHVREQSDFSWIGSLGQQAASQRGIARGKKRRCLEARLVWRKSTRATSGVTSTIGLGSASENTLLGKLGEGKMRSPTKPRCDAQRSDGGSRN